MITQGVISGVKYVATRMGSNAVVSLAGKLNWALGAVQMVDLVNNSINVNGYLHLGSFTPVVEKPVFDDSRLTDPFSVIAPYPSSNSP